MQKQVDSLLTTLCFDSFEKVYGTFPDIVVLVIGGLHGKLSHTLRYAMLTDSMLLDHKFDVF